MVRFIAHGLSAGAEDLLHDAGATAAILVGGYACVFAFNDLTRREVLQQNLSRKLVHMLSGLLFLASWPIFRGTLLCCLCSSGELLEACGEWSVIDVR